MMHGPTELTFSVKFINLSLLTSLKKYGWRQMTIFCLLVKLDQIEFNASYIHYYVAVQLLAW